MTGETVDLSQCGNQAAEKEAETEKDKKVSIIEYCAICIVNPEPVINWRDGRRLATNTGI